MGKKPYLVDFFGNNANEYEQNKNLKKLQYTSAIRALELLTENKSFKKTCRVLDIGCGTGWSMEVFIENGFKNVIGIDLSENMLEIAKSKNLEVYQADILKELPFSNHHFDAIISISVINFIIENVKRPEQLLTNCNIVSKELYRILKQNGRAVIQFHKNKSLETALINAFNAKHFSGYLVIDDQNLRKERRFFVLDK